MGRSKYCGKYGKSFVFEESEQEYIERKVYQDRYNKEFNERFERKNPTVNFSLDTNNEKVIGAYNKLINGFTITKPKYSTYHGHRET
ncbi:MAG: hypothetical protein V4549_07525 [Bacteroidota bacterium]